MNTNNLPKNLKEILQALDMSPSQLAARTGLTPSAVSQIMSGENSPSLDSIIKIMNVIPVTFERLLK